MSTTSYKQLSIRASNMTATKRAIVEWLRHQAAQPGANAIDGATALQDAAEVIEAAKWVPGT